MNVDNGYAESPEMKVKLIQMNISWLLPSYAPRKTQIRSCRPEKTFFNFLDLNFRSSSTSVFHGME